MLNDKMKFQEDKTIVINRELSELDKFTIKFCKVLENHSDYVLVSGYVSILLGRSRSSENIDLLVPKMSEKDFVNLVNDLIKNNFYCINTDETKEMYEMLMENIAIRFAINDNVIPNMELKFASNKIHTIALQTKNKVEINQEILFISNLELQIAFKENVLKSPKDMEDAMHIRMVAKDILNLKLIKEYKVMLDEVYK